MDNKIPNFFIIEELTYLAEEVLRSFSSIVRTLRKLIAVTKFFQENVVNLLFWVVLQTDENALLHVLARLHDPEIDRWTPYQKVKSILLERTERVSGWDCSTRTLVAFPQGLSTENKLPKNVQFCLSF